MEDYLEKLKIEFYELQDKVIKLEDTIDQCNKFQLSWIPDVPLSVYEEQLFYMQKYLDTLAFRLRLNGVEVYP